MTAQHDNCMATYRVTDINNPTSHTTHSINRCCPGAICWLPPSACHKPSTWFCRDECDERQCTTCSSKCKRVRLTAAVQRNHCTHSIVLTLIAASQHPMVIITTTAQSSADPHTCRTNWLLTAASQHTMVITTTTPQSSADHTHAGQNGYWQLPVNTQW